MSGRKGPLRLVSDAGPLVGPRLEWLAEGLPRSHPLKGRVHVGRQVQDGLVLDAPEVSKEHCVLEVVDGHWVVKDRGSSNGTFVNGRKVTERQLFDGDLLGVGNVELVFRWEEGPARSLRDERLAGDYALLRVADLDRMRALQGEPGLDVPSTDPVGPFSTAPRPRKPQERRDWEDKARIALDLHRGLAREVEPRSVEVMLVHAARALVRADNAALYLGDDLQGPRPRVASRYGDPGGPLLVPPQLVRRAAALRQVVTSASAVRDPDLRDAEGVQELGVRSLLVVPVALGERGLGALYLDSRRHDEAFDAADSDLVLGMAGHAAALLLALRP